MDNYDAGAIAAFDLTRDDRRRRGGWLALLSAGALMLAGLAAAHAQAGGGLRLEAVASGDGSSTPLQLAVRVENAGAIELRDLRFYGRDASTLACADETAGGAEFDLADGVLAPGDSIACTATPATIAVEGSARLIVVGTGLDGRRRKAEHAYGYGFGALPPVVLPDRGGMPQAQAVVLIGAVHDDADFGFDFTPGETIAFTFTVVNTGDDPLDTIAVSDTFGTAISCPPGPLAPGAALVCTSSYTIQAGDDAFLLINDASLTAQGSGSVPVAAQDSLLMLAGFTADARMFKAPLLTTDSNNDGYAGVGDVVSYQFVIKNSSAEDLTLDSLGDPLPNLGAIACAAATLGGSAFGGIPGGTLAAGDSVVCTADYTVTAADRSNGQVNNSAAVEATSATTFSVVATGASATVTIPSATVEIIKTSLGGTDSFEFTLVNAETSPVTVTTTAAGMPESSGPIFVDAIGNADLLVTETDPAPDYVLLSATCTDGTDTWPLTAGSVTVPMASIEPGTAIQCSFTNATAPDVEVDKELTGENGAIPGQAEAGEQLTYTITLTNTGFAPALNQPITDQLDPNVTFVSASNGGTLVGTQVQWTGLTVPAATTGGPGVLTLTVVVQVVDPIPDGVLSIGNVAYDPTDPPPNCQSVPTPPNCTITPTEPNVTPSKALTAESGTIPGQAEAGEQLTYTITLTNTGGSDATNYPMVDQLDPNVTFVSASNGGTLVGTQVQWTGLTVPANGTLVLTVVVQVVDPIPDGVLSIGNVAYTPTEPPPNCQSVPTPPNCTITPTEPNVTPSKALTGENGIIPGQAEAGEQLTYTITLTNTGGADATNYPMVDQLDPNVTFVSASNGGTLVGSQVQWTGLTVPANGTLVLTVVVQVVDPIPAGVLSIGNVAYTPTEPPPNCEVTPLPPNCTVTPTEPSVTPSKALTAESGTIPGQAEAGEQLTYTITLTNTGGADATNYPMVDQLDPNVTFVSASNGGTLVGSQVQWTGLTVPANGTLVLTVVVQVVDPIPDGVLSIGNVAYTPTEPPPNCEVTPLPPNCTITPTEPNVSTGKALTAESGTIPGQAEPGEQLTYTITLTNTGGSDATNYPQVDQLDPNVTFVSASNGGTLVGTQVQWTGLTVPANGTLVLTVVVQVVDPIPAGVLTIGNVAYDPTEPPPNCDVTPLPPNCTSTPTEPSVAPSKALTAESGTIPGQAEAGEQLTYTITLTNTGGADATNYPMVDQLDPNVTFVSASNGGTLVGSQVQWTGLTVPANGTLVLTVVVQVVDPIPAGVLSIGNVAYTPTEPPPNCQSVPTPPNCTITPTEPNVTPSKALTGENGAIPGQAEAGEQLTYTITLTNTGGADATNYPMVDQLDPNVTFVSASNGGTLVGSQVQWTGLTVPANGTLVLTVVVQVVDPIPAGVLSIGNVAYTPTEPPPNCDVTPLPPNCTVTPTEPSVAPSKALTGENGAIPGQAEPGEQLTYTITLTNTGGADATNYPMVDQLDPNVTFVSASNGGTLVGTQVQWTGLTVPANGTLVLTVVVQVVDPIPDGVASIDNVAYTPTEPPPNCDVTPLPPNCTVTPTEPSVTPSKALTGENGTVPGQAEAGEQLTYTITLTNNGGADATNYPMVDQLDPNVTFVSASNGGTLVGSQVQWTGLTVPANGTLVLTVVVQVVDPIPDGVTEIGNVAYTPTEPPPNCEVTPLPPNCTVTPTEPSVTTGKALTGESGTQAGVAEAGEQLTYTITLTNSGGADATNYPQVDQLDPNVTFVSASNGGTLVGSQVQWTGLTVPANGTLVLTVVVQVVDPIPDGVTEIGNVAYNPTDPPPNCDVTPLPPNCTVTPTEPGVTTAKALTAESGTVPGQAEAGEQLTYTITLTNNGGADATNYPMVDQLDPNVTFVSASNGGTLVGTQVQWTGLTVPANGTLVLTVVVQVVDPIPAGVTQIDNVAFNPDEGPPDCDATPTPPNCVSVPADPRRPVLTINKVASPTSYSPGGSGTYTVSVAVAAGSVPLSAGPVVVLDPMPSPLAITGAVTGSNWDCSGSTAAEAMCTYVGPYPLTAGSAVGGAITIPFTVPANAAAGGIVNIAAVTYGPDQTVDEDEATIVVVVGEPEPPQPVPLDSPWMLWLLGLLLLGVAIAADGRRHRR